MFSDVPSVCLSDINPLSVNTVFTFCDISVVSRRISSTLVTYIRYVTGNYYKGLHGQRSASYV